MHTEKFTLNIDWRVIYLKKKVSHCLWMWYKESNLYLGKSRKATHGERNEKSSLFISNHNPLSVSVWTANHADHTGQGPSLHQLFTHQSPRASTVTRVHDTHIIWRRLNFMWRVVPRLGIVDLGRYVLYMWIVPHQCKIWHSQQIRLKTVK